MPSRNRNEIWTIEWFKSIYSVGYGTNYEQMPTWIVGTIMKQPMIKNMSFDEFSATANV